MATGVDDLLSRVRARRRLPAAAERREIRERAGVSQRELALALDVSWTAVHRWEKGARRSHETAYADALEGLKQAASP